MQNTFLESLLYSQFSQKFIKVLLCLGSLAEGMDRISLFEHYRFKPLCIMESLVFFFFALAFAVRTPAKIPAQGAKEILLPGISLVAPFLFSFLPSNHYATIDPAILGLSSIWMTAASVLMIFSIWELRHSFSVVIEARSLVKTGPYRWIRHPLYLGEICAFFGLILTHWSFVNLALFLISVCFQFSRAYWEEKKLMISIPEYKDFAQSTWWIWKAR